MAVEGVMEGGQEGGKVDHFNEMQTGWLEIVHRLTEQTVGWPRKSLLLASKTKQK